MCSKSLGKETWISPDEYLVGRDGDHLMVPFECDLCIFQMLRLYEPSCRSEEDILLLACIHRVSLDAFGVERHPQF
jgi:hypothetical protein